MTALAHREKMGRYDASRPAEYTRVGELDPTIGLGTDGLVCRSSKADNPAPRGQQDWFVNRTIVFVHYSTIRGGDV